MSEFKWEWTDELVTEFVVKEIDSLAEADRIDVRLAHFKASKQPKTEWEILEGWGAGGIHSWQEKSDGVIETCKYRGCKIHSIKRVSDGEIFSRGDVVGIQGAKEPHAIIEFEIDDKIMIARFSCFPGYDIKMIRHLKHSPIPVLLTPSQIEKLKKLLNE